MDLQELGDWLSNSAVQNIRKYSGLLGSLAETLDAGIAKECNPYRAFEITASSTKGSDFFQLTHIVLYRPSQNTAKVRQQKVAAIANAIKNINQRQGGWPIALIEDLLWDDGQPGMLDIFSFEFDAKSGTFIKMTLYGTPESQNFGLLERKIGLPCRAWLERATKEDYDCIGIDFWVGQLPQLKVYQRSIFKAQNIKNRVVRSACEIVSQQIPVRHLMFLKRLQMDVTASSMPKVILRLEKAIRADDLMLLKGLEVMHPFLKGAGPSFAGQYACYLSFDAAGGVEFSFRHNQPPWVGTV